MRTWKIVLTSLVVAVGLHLGCKATRPLVRIDGDGEAFLLSQRVAERYAGVDDRADVEVSDTGSRAAFAALCMGRLDAVGMAGRPSAGELTWCELQGAGIVEIPIGYSAVAVVVSARNGFVSSLRVDELRRLWLRSSPDAARTFRDLRPEWPDVAPRLFGLDREDGAHVRMASALRARPGEALDGYTVVGDADAVLDEVSDDDGAVGFVDLASALRRAGDVRLVALDRAREGRAEIIAPSWDAVVRGDYAPLSAPISLFASAAALERRPARAFVEYYGCSAARIASEIGYRPTAATPDLQACNCH